MYFLVSKFQCVVILSSSVYSEVLAKYFELVATMNDIDSVHDLYICKSFN